MGLCAQFSRERGDGHLNYRRAWSVYIAYIFECQPIMVRSHYAIMLCKHRVLNNET